MSDLTGYCSLCSSDSLMQKDRSAGEKLQGSPGHTQTLPIFRTVQAGMNSLVMGGTSAFPRQCKPP